ncbi:hypothetical protein [Cohnella thermotolerans]|uniref:hypothetical protein n=1 Tax=Cohnella thermotolerans TaxID=329858 RepID=UPI0012EBFAFA|nr:hypothetical protein [Cohnella thermotolerans]
MKKQTKKYIQAIPLLLPVEKDSDHYTKGLNHLIMQLEGTLNSCLIVRKNWGDNVAKHGEGLGYEIVKAVINGDIIEPITFQKVRGYSR